MPYVHACDEQLGLDFAQVVQLLGGKAANLAVMAAELGLPVPPAFTITTAACNEYLANGWPDGLDAELRDQMATMEIRVGHGFGDPDDPLLVSVRSGAPVSMPGMMDTILNLGLNDATTAGLAASSGSPKFAADCRSRFEAMYREIVGVSDVPADPWVQLRAAVEAVFRSWNGDRARTFRRREGIPDDLGTAVTVQAMVFGNRSVDSGTGVLFTRNPATGEAALYGDFMFNAQGEDVVAGTHRTEHVTVLDARIPAVGRQLREYAQRLERHHRDMCDIEFTVEHGRLWMLQCRVGKRTPQAALRIALEMAEDAEFPLTRAEAVRRVLRILADPPKETARRGDVGPALAVGLPASPGVACGEIVTTPDGAVEAAATGRTVILVRAETSPDDVHGMAHAAGILTEKGGLASHAAVVARGWGIPAVVGASDVHVTGTAVVAGGRTLAVGDTITIDGTTGEVFAGAVAGAATVMPEVATLLGWARDLGIDAGVAADAPDAASVDAGSATEDASEATADGVVRALAIKGYGTHPAIAVAMGAREEALAPLVERLVADGLVEPSAGQFRLTAAGKARGQELLAVDRTHLGPAGADAALDALLAFDQRVKQAASEWQMRDVEAGVFNDHGDADYDAAVLAGLVALHDDVAPWLRSIAPGLPRLRAYLDRLDAAARLAGAGDGRYVASPRVDSYHGIWFELHEDLIRLAGRNRADEVAAGRA